MEGVALSKIPTNIWIKTQVLIYVINMYIVILIDLLFEPIIKVADTQAQFNRCKTFYNVVSFFKWHFSFLCTDITMQWCLLSCCSAQLWHNSEAFAADWHLAITDLGPVPLNFLWVIYGHFAVYYEIFEIMSKFMVKIWP